MRWPAGPGICVVRSTRRRSRGDHVRQGALAVAVQVVFAASRLPPPASRQPTGYGPVVALPLFARTWEPSTQVRDQASSLSAFNSARGNWSKAQACCQRSTRRQLAYPEPNPCSSGRFLPGDVVVAGSRECPSCRGCLRPEAGPASTPATEGAVAPSVPTARLPRSTVVSSHTTNGTNSPQSTALQPTFTRSCRDLVITATGVF